MTSPASRATFTALVSETGQLLGSLEQTLSDLAEFTVHLREQLQAERTIDDAQP